MKKKIILGLVFAFFAAVFIFSSKVLAQDSTASGENIVPTPKPTIRTIFFGNKPVGESTKSGEIKRVKGLDKLTNLRLKSCEKHKDEIDTRLTSLGKLVANILGKFDAIAVRVEQFYTNKVLGSGKVVPNYKDLTDAIAVKKEAVNTALLDTQADVKDFKCTADNPKGQLKLFKDDMQLVKKALHDYRTSIKNLIVAVKSVNGDTEDEASKSAQPQQ